MNDRISTIRSIIEKNYSEVTYIWNLEGKQMKNDQIVTEIDTNENYKLIFRCDDGEGNEIDNTFDRCCYLHDINWTCGYLLNDKLRDYNKNESTRTLLINLIDQIRQIISSNNTIDDRLNRHLSDLPSSFINSTILFTFDMADCILYICDDYWRFVMNQYTEDVVAIFDQYFIFAIQAALWDFCNIRQQHNNKTNKSISDIVIDALDYFVKYLIDSNNDWQYWLRLWMNQYSLKSISDSHLNEWIEESKTNKFTIKVKMNGVDAYNFIQFKPKTIIEAKQSLSAVLHVEMKHLYCIKPGGDYRPNDEEKFDDEFIIEIVLSMDDIDILKSLGEGGFANIYLCRDKISNQQFVLKKAIRINEDLYRDISIHSKINPSRNNMNYSALFRDGESICIGMEYMSGGSLRSYLAKGKHFSEQEIVKISYQIVTQINELHKLGIIHRDIKPDNIVFDEHNYAKLIDFGISKYTTGLTKIDLSDKLKAYKPGTIYYMAPELIKEEQYSEKIDIWSFGIVMVEMVTGKRQYHSKTIFRIILKIRDCTKYEFEPLFPISNELKQFISSCLNINPNERPSAEHLKKSELFICLRD